MSDFLKSQIITYMGNKRKLLPDLSKVIDDLKYELNVGQNDELVTADAFAGSGIVSRLLKTKSTTLYTNDIAGYSKTLNECFLSTPSKNEQQNIQKIIDAANKFAHADGDGDSEPWIRKHWAPDGKPKKGERVYFTEKNALLIDKYMHFIKNGNYPKKYKSYLLASLLVKSSIHNNTNGQFSAFYKDENGIGKYGGKMEIDVKRITRDIVLEMPIFSPHPCRTIVSQKDVSEWIDKIPPVDIMYLDPPYNKHPYSIYYFMLDIINNWDTTQEIPNSNRGQPKNWNKSDYNSFSRAEDAFTEMFKKIKAKFVVISYNNKGIIPIKNLEKILASRGKVYTRPVNHPTYNKLKGIANYKRTAKWEDVKEFIWVVDLR